MKLTVVSASYNALSSFGIEKIKSCIRSVAALPIEHEHLIYDGASTDGTVEVLNQFAQEIPSLKVVSEKDSGIYEALNKGLRDAKGEYFYVIGMDDQVIDVEAFRDCVEKAIKKNADMLIAKITVQGEHDTFPPILLDGCRHARECSYAHQGVIIRTSLLRKNPFDQSYRIAADYKQTLTLNWNGAKVRMINKRIAYFSKGGTSADAKTIAEALKAHKEVFSLTDLEERKLSEMGQLPFRVAKHFMTVGSAFSFCMGLNVLWSYIWRKHKTNLHSKYYLFNLLIYRHIKKSVKCNRGKRF